MMEATQIAIIGLLTAILIELFRIERVLGRVTVKTELYQRDREEEIEPLKRGCPLLHRKE